MSALAMSKGILSESQEPGMQPRCSALWMIPPSRDPSRLTAYTFLDEEVVALAARGAELHALCYEKRGKLTDDLTVHVVPVKWELASSLKSMLIYRECRAHPSLAARKFLDRIRLAHVQSSIEQVVRRNQIDLIHSHWAGPAATAGVLAAERARVPLVMTLHGADVLEERSIDYGQTLDPWARGRIEYAVSRADAIIVASDCLADRAVELGARRERIHLIRRTVDTEQFQLRDAAIARARLGIEERPTALYVGNLVPVKGLFDLVTAMQRLVEVIPSVQLLVCGDGRLRDDVARSVNQAGLGRSIKLVGFVARDNLPDYFAATDLFVLPSLSEGAGNVLLEAAACGRATVATRVGGIPDYVVDGVTGLLCNKHDPEDLAAKMLELLQNKEQANQLGSTARARVVAEFQFEQMITETLRVYEAVLDGHSCQSSREGD